MSRYVSVPGLFGEMKHYDESGNCVAESWEGIVPGTTVHYAADGSVIGSSMDGLFGDVRHYDAENRLAASSMENPFGITDHYDSSGELFGSSWSGFAGENTDIDFSF